MLESISSFFAIFLFSHWKSDISIIHENKKCAILSNGPSLTDDLEKLACHQNILDFVCVNDFSLSEYFLKIRPKYYVFLDPFYWEDSLTGNDLVLRRSVFDRITTITSWEMKILIPFEMKKSNIIKYLKIFSNNKNIKLLYYNRTPIKGFEWFTFFCLKNNFGLPSGQNVLVAAILLSINLGYKTLLLFGADHSLHEHIDIDSNNNVYVGQKHFYDGNRTVKKMYSRSYVELKPLNMNELFGIWAKAFESYMILNRYAKKQNSIIYNSSSKSYIDAFERKFQ